MISPNEGLMVHRHEERGNELAVHAVRNPAVSRNDRIEVLDAVGSLYRACPQSSERRDHRRERGHKQRVQLDGRHHDACRWRSEEEKDAHERSYAFGLSHRRVTDFVYLSNAGERESVCFD